MLVQIYKVDEVTFNKVYETCFIKEVSSSEMRLRLTIGRRGMDKKIALYDKDKKTLLCRALDLQYILDNVDNNNWKDIALQIDASASKVLDTTDIYIRPYAKQANAYIAKILSDYYTEDEIDECLKSHVVQELTGETKMLRLGMPWYYDADKLYHFDNVVYYDINNAHLDALTEIFPKAKAKLTAIRTRINKFKQEGKDNKARYLKDIVNFYVGDLCNRGYRTTNNWIVARTRAKVDKLIDYVKGTILYANTDGVIINNPENKITTSTKLGDFKDEITDGQLWYYLNTKQTRWQLYQYHSKKGTEKKGTAPLLVRDKIDLENNKIVLFDLDWLSKIRKPINIKEIDLCQECQEDKQ